MVFADVWMFICPLQVMWLQCGSCGSDCGHMIMTWVQSGHMITKKTMLQVLGYQPWIPVQDKKSKWQMMSA